jgi:[ribosomal protein S5]-alanine N-acetyltransferase
MVITETERIILRHFHIADGEAMAELFADPEVMQFGPGPQPLEWVHQWLEGCLEDYFQKWGFGIWAVIHKPDRRVIGFCGLTRFEDIDGRPEIEVGYRLVRAYWGRGLATEAARTVRDYAFQVLTLTRLVSIIDSRNAASARVAEKIGMHREKEVPFRGKIHWLYSVHWDGATP